MGAFIDKLLGGGIKAITEGIDTIFTSKEEKQQLINELEAMNLRDRDSARDMYKSDSSLQKWFAAVFLGGYMLLIGGMIYYIFTISTGADESNLPEWAVAFLSTIFGAMSAKVSTITDFLFGGSKTAEIQDRRK